MLEAASPSLAQSVAGIADALRADADHRRTGRAPWAAPGPAIHALILATLAQLVQRLADLIGRWEAGLCPPVPAPRPAAPRPRPVPAPAGWRFGFRFPWPRWSLLPSFHAVQCPAPAAHGAVTPRPVRPRPAGSRTRAIAPDSVPLPVDPIAGTGRLPGTPGPIRFHRFAPATPPLAPSRDAPRPAPRVRRRAARDGPSAKPRRRAHGRAPLLLR